MMAARDDEIEKVLDLLVKANRILAHEQIVDDFGHISVRNPANPQHFFISCAISPARVTREDIYEFWLTGEAVSDLGGRPAYSERAIHGAIYERRPDVMAVCHHHSSALLPFTCSDIPLRPIYHLGCVIGERVPVWDSQDRFGDTSMLVDDMEKGRDLAEALGDNVLVLMRRHGAVLAGPSIKHVVLMAIYSAENAKLQKEAMTLGTPSYLTAGEIEKAARVILSPQGIDRSWPNRCIRAGLPLD